MSQYRYQILLLAICGCLSSGCSRPAEVRADPGAVAPSDKRLAILQEHLDSSPSADVAEFHRRYPKDRLGEGTPVFALADQGERHRFEVWADDTKTCLIIAEVDVAANKLLKATFRYDEGPMARVPAIAAYYAQLRPEDQVGTLSSTPDLDHARVKSAYVDDEGEYVLMLLAPSTTGHSYLWSYAFDESGRVLPNRIHVVTH